GLQGNLVGRLNVAQKDKGPFILGEVNIRNGQYRSFGQDLQIKEGKSLASSQLDRLKAAGLPLTIAVDKVAASGGYMM
ncbi:hypothetical protein, partial [Vibrio cholerae]|uniref:hypothetical protein n=1 Tax=Vibrio cholerae TaxID=666 RepID=UPI001595147B